MAMTPPNWKLVSVAWCLIGMWIPYSQGRVGGFEIGRQIASGVGEVDQVEVQKEWNGTQCHEHQEAKISRIHGAVCKSMSWPKECGGEEGEFWRK